MGNCQTTKTHKVVVTTGDKKSGGATDINVHLTLTDVKDSVSKEIKLTSVWNNDFRKGQQEQFNLDLPGLTKIKEISVRRDEAGAKDDWFVDRVEITCITDNSKPSIFPFHRWIHADTKLSLVEFDTTLPQFEKHPEQREKELKQKREKYILVSKILGAPRQVEILPEDEQFSYAYEFDIAKEYASQLIKTTLIDWTTPEFDSLQDMKDIFKKCNIKVPSGIKDWRLDESFGNQKLCGCNPGIIQLCTQIPDYFAVTADLVEPFLEGKTLQTALSQKRLYMIDLRYLSEVECPRSCVLPGPTCLLYVKDSKDLVPVAIQLMPKPGSDNPVFTPADPEYTWMAAKMWFNFAETADHESASHLGHTHLLIESVAVCTHRELSPSHPMFRLLAPHFLYVMPINDGAIRSLVSTDGWIEKTMSIGRVGMFNIIRLKWAEWNLQEDGNFVKNLKRRGVDDVSALPNYHYRDDGLLIWRAIENYVRKVVNTVYDQPQKLSADTEIEAWREALIKDAEFKGIVDKFSTNEDLIEVLTVFIFITSAVHASLNFGQYDVYGFPPNYPTVMNHTKWPTTKEPLDEDYIVKSLPPKRQALDIIFILKVLSERGTNSLGDYTWRYAYGPLLEPALNEFRAELADVAATVDARNKRRERPYDYLHPREIPNSISI